MLSTSFGEVRARRKRDIWGWSAEGVDTVPVIRPDCEDTLLTRFHITSAGDCVCCMASSQSPANEYCTIAELYGCEMGAIQP
jgi:hypothetical protein